MKILIATSSVTPNSGVPSYNKELSAFLQENNEVDLLVDENITDYPNYNNIYSTALLNPFTYNGCKEWVNIINAKDYDIIINSKSQAMAILAPYIADRTRIITISHSLGTLDCDIAAYNCKYLDTIICLSVSCKKYLARRFRYASKKIAVIFNSVRDYDNAVDLRRRKKESHILSIVFAGGSAPSKSPELVIDILQKLKETTFDFKFYWLGNITPPLKKIQPFRNVADIIGSKDSRIIFTGRIPRQEATRIIAECDIFLAPSKREGFPMALLEAMRVGCIPLVSDFDIANKEVITNGMTGFIIPHTEISSFVERILDIIHNHEQYAAIYDASAKYFQDFLSMNVWRKRMNALVNSTTTQHKKRIKLSRGNFYFNIIKFMLLDIENLIENYIGEIIPSAYKIYRQYRRR